MSKWSNANTLSDFKNILNTILNDKNNDGTLLLEDVIETTSEETQTLCERLTHINSSKELDKYCICLIVAWVESYRHHRKDIFMKRFMERYHQIPQHALGRYLITYQDTFCEYDLETFGITFTSLDDIEMVIMKHAGLAD